jgi:hypothetical protein
MVNGSDESLTNNKAEACLQLIGEVISDYPDEVNIASEYQELLVKILTAVDGVVETTNSLDKYLDRFIYDKTYADYLWEAASEMVILEIRGTNRLRAEACLILVENNFNLASTIRINSQHMAIISQFLFKAAETVASVPLFRRTKSLLAFWPPVAYTQIAIESRSIMTIHSRIMTREEENHGETISSGAFGTVYRISEDTVVKSQEIYPISSVPRVAAINELNALRQLRHENVIQLKKFSISEDLNLNLYLEYAPRSFSSVSGHPGYYNQLMRGVDFIHSRGFLHMDIKPSNILISREDVVLIADFGTSAVYAPGLEYNVNVGTVNYRAPELLKFGSSFRKRARIDYNADIWSCAATILEKELDVTAFPGDTESDVIDSIDRMLGFRSIVWKSILEGLELDPEKARVDSVLLSIPNTSVRDNLQRMLVFGTNRPMAHQLYFT